MRKEIHQIKERDSIDILDNSTSESAGQYYYEIIIKSEDIKKDREFIESLVENSDWKFYDYTTMRSKDYHIVDGNGNRIEVDFRLTKNLRNANY